LVKKCCGSSCSCQKKSCGSRQQLPEAQFVNNILFEVESPVSSPLDKEHKFQPKTYKKFTLKNFKVSLMQEILA
jgi:hypothetical protein